MTKRFQASLEIFDVDVYVVAHHGSKNGLVKQLLSKMTPKVAVIPMGPYGRRLEWTGRIFGHPNERIIRMLQEARTGVGWQRLEPKNVMVGIRGAWEERTEEFRKETIREAIYATGWDGTVVVSLAASGAISVHDADGREL